MGCDIHMYIEYREKKEKQEDPHHWWYNFGGKFNPGRDYTMFGLLSSGVRTSFEQSHPQKGELDIDDMSWVIMEDAFLYITETGIGENEITIDEAIKYSKQYGSKIHRSKKDNEPTWVSHPDWHSHSWLTIEEFEKSLKDYSTILSDFADDGPHYPSVQYDAILASMKALSNNGENEVRLVFWFDN